MDAGVRATQETKPRRVAEFTKVNGHFCVPLGYETIFNVAIAGKILCAKVSVNINLKGRR